MRQKLTYLTKHAVLNFAMQFVSTKMSPDHMEYLFTAEDGVLDATIGLWKCLILQGCSQGKSKYNTHIWYRPDGAPLDGVVAWEGDGTALWSLDVVLEKQSVADASEARAEELANERQEVARSKTRRAGALPSEEEKAAQEKKRTSFQTNQAKAFSSSSR